MLRGKALYYIPEGGIASDVNFIFQVLPRFGQKRYALCLNFGTVPTAGEKSPVKCMVYHACGLICDDPTSTGTASR